MFILPFCLAGFAEAAWAECQLHDAWFVDREQLDAQLTLVNL